MLEFKGGSAGVKGSFGDVESLPSGSKRALSYPELELGLQSAICELSPCDG